MLTRKVNGVEVALSAQEEAAIKAEWAKAQQKRQQRETARQARERSKEEALEKMARALGMTVQEVNDAIAAA